MAVGVESQGIPKGLDGNDGARDCILLLDNGLEKRFQRFPCTSAQFGEESSIIEEVSPEDFGYAEDEVPMGNDLENLLAEPFTELHYPFLVAGGAKGRRLHEKAKRYS